MKKEYKKETEFTRKIRAKKRKEQRNLQYKKSSKKLNNNFELGSGLNFLIQ